MTKCWPSAVLAAAGLLAALLPCLPPSVLANGSDDGLCPPADRTSGQPDSSPLVTSYLSVDSADERPPACGMSYKVPSQVTLYQGMLAANQQYGSGFKFETTLYPPWGHFIDSINGLGSMDGFYWLLYDNATLMTTPVGADWIDLVADSSYIWFYDNSSSHNGSYSGPCESPVTVSPPMPLTYRVAYLSVNTRNASQVHVCKRIVLIPDAPATNAYSLLELANDQLPIYVKATLNASDMTVTAFDGVENSATHLWTGYRAGSNDPIPSDLTETEVAEWEHLEFRYDELLEDDGGNGGAPPSGQTMSLLLAAGALTRAILLMME